MEISGGNIEGSVDLLSIDREIDVANPVTVLTAVTLFSPPAELRIYSSMLFTQQFSCLYFVQIRWICL